MANDKLETMIAELKEWEQLKAEAEEQVENLKDQLKAEMVKRDTEELPVGKYIMRYAEVLSNRFDTTAFKRVHLDLYQAFTKQTTSRRFTIS